MWNILKEFNNQKGRFNRFKFWVYAIILQVIFILISTIVTYIWESNNILFLTQVGPLLWMLWVLYITFTAYIKRLHDLDKSGWMSLLILIPFANIYIFVICGFFKWTVWENKYWPDPLGWINNNKNKIPDEL